VDDADLARELKEAEKVYATAELRYEGAKQHRDELIWKALAQRWTYADVAEITGLSRQRIGQIAQQAPDWRPRGRQR
jgi:hypothetical protein